jgi:hypothetical protein
VTATEREERARLLLRAALTEGERGLLGKDEMADWLAEHGWRTATSGIPTRRTIKLLRQDHLPMVPGLDQRRLPWTHSHLLAAFLAVDEGVIESPPAWQVLLRSRWWGPDILEPALLAILRAALPQGEVDLVGWDLVSLWLSVLRWRTHNHATAPTAQTLSGSWRRWGLPAILVSVPGKPGRSILTTNYRLLARLVAQPRQKRGLRPPQAPRPGYVQRIMFPDAPPRPSACSIYAREVLSSHGAPAPVSVPPDPYARQQLPYSPPFPDTDPESWLKV